MFAPPDRLAKGHFFNLFCFLAFLRGQNGSLGGPFLFLENPCRQSHRTSLFFGVKDGSQVDYHGCNHSLHFILLCMRLLFTLCFLLSVLASRAQVFMRPFDNAAAMGLGGATIAHPTMSAGITNDAQLGLGEQVGVFAGSAIPYGIGSWKTAQFQAFHRLDKNSALGLDVVHSGIEVYAEQQFRLLYGRRLGEKFYLGGGAHVLRSSAQEYGSSTSATFSISVLAHALPKIWIGAKILNPVQQKIGGETIRSGLRLGAAWQASTLLTVLAEMEKDLERPAQIKAGMEYNPVSVLMLRVGVRSGHTARIGFGAGLKLKNGLRLDVGSEWHPTLGMTPAAMISWRR